MKVDNEYIKSSGILPKSKSKNTEWCTNKRLEFQKVGEKKCIAAKIFFLFYIIFYIIILTQKSVLRSNFSFLVSPRHVILGAP